LGDIKASSVLRIDEKGEWTELAEITIASQPSRKLMELSVSQQKSKAVLNGLKLKDSWCRSC